MGSTCSAATSLRGAHRCQLRQQQQQQTFKLISEPSSPLERVAPPEVAAPAPLPPHVAKTTTAPFVRNSNLLLGNRLTTLKQHNSNNGSSGSINGFLRTIVYGGDDDDDADRRSPTSAAEASVSYYAPPRGRFEAFDAVARLKAAAASSPISARSPPARLITEAEEEEAAALQRQLQQRHNPIISPTHSAGLTTSAAPRREGRLQHDTSLEASSSSSLYHRAAASPILCIPSDEAWRSAERRDVECFEEQMAVIEALRYVHQSHSSPQSSFSSSSSPSSKVVYVAGSGIAAARRPNLVARRGTAERLTDTAAAFHQQPVQPQPLQESPSTASTVRSFSEDVQRKLHDVESGADLPLFVPLPPPIRAREDQTICDPMDPILHDSGYRSYLMPRSRDLIQATPFKQPRTVSSPQ